MQTRRPPSWETPRLNLRAVPEQTFVALHTRAAQERRSCQAVANDILSQALAPDVAPWYLCHFPRPLTEVIQAYAEAQGHTLLDQIILDLGEAYGVEV